MEEALRGYLLAIPDLANLLGTRVDWGSRPQGDALPALVLHLISDVPQMNVAEPGGWRKCRVQGDFWGRTYKDARDAAAIVARRASGGGLHGLRAELSGIRFRVWVLSAASDRDEDSKGVVHRTRLDLRVWCQRD